jgi:hypothetical protein
LSGALARDNIDLEEEHGTTEVKIIVSSSNTFLNGTNEGRVGVYTNSKN